MRSTPPVETRHWTRVEYERLVEQGIFASDERLELIAGVLVMREPQTSPHAAAIHLTERALQRAFGDAWHVRTQAPVALGDDSEPEPDVCVVAGGPRDYVAHHPVAAVLIVEVSTSSLAFDREYKSSLYARAPVADYWIVNLVDGALEVRRGPALADTAPYGWAYETLAVLGRDDAVTPLAAPRARIPVADLLP